MQSSTSVKPQEQGIKTPLVASAAFQGKVIEKAQYGNLDEHVKSLLDSSWKIKTYLRENSTAVTFIGLSDQNDLEVHFQNGKGFTLFKPAELSNPKFWQLTALAARRVVLALGEAKSSANLAKVAQPTREPPSPKSPAAKMNDLTSCMLDVSSASRNGMTVVATVTGGGGMLRSAVQMSTMLHLATIVSSLIATFSAVYGTMVRSVRLKDAWKNGDGEGMRVHALDLLTFGAYSLSASTWFTSSSIGFSGASATVKAAAAAKTAGIVSGFAGVVMNGFLALFSLYGLLIAGKFGHDLSKTLDPKGAGTESQKLIEALKDLKRRTTLTEGEALLASRPGNQAEEAAERQRIMKGKEAAFARRTSRACFDLVSKANFDAMINGLEAGNATQVNAAKIILREVYKANYQAKIRFCRLLLIALIGAAAFTLGLIFTGGIANLFFLYGASHWSGIDCEAFDIWINEKVWKHRENAALPEMLRTEAPPAAKEQAKFLAAVALAVIFSPVWMVPKMLHLMFKSSGLSEVKSFDDMKAFGKKKLAELVPKASP